MSDIISYGKYVNDFLNEAHKDKNIKSIQINIHGLWHDIVTNGDNFIHCVNSYNSNEEMILNTNTLGGCSFRKVYE